MIQDKNKKAAAFLDALEKEIKNSGTHVEKQELPNNQYSVVGQFKTPQDPDLALSFMYNIIPDNLGLTPNQINLQTFVEINGTVAEEKFEDIRKMIAQVNPFLPIGHFGLFEKYNILYWKQNNYLDSNLENAINADLVMAQTKFSINVIMDFRLTFVDALMDVKTPEESLRDNKWASIIFA